MSAGTAAELVWNIGHRPMLQIYRVARDTIFVDEFSGQQLAQIHTSLHFAVLLIILPVHLAYCASFATASNTPEPISASGFMTIRSRPCPKRRSRRWRHWVQMCKRLCWADMNAIWISIRWERNYRALSGRLFSFRQPASGYGRRLKA